MTLTTYLLYITAVAVLVLSPGPTMLMCITRAIQNGPGAALSAGLGSVSAALGTMLLSALGLGALLAASELAFNVLKLVGAAYLIYLGIKTWRSPAAVLGQAGAEAESEAAPAHRTLSRRASYAQGFMVGASNPKALLFAAAFFPQFLNPATALLPQFAVLGTTFAAMELTVLSVCAFGAARVAPLLTSADHIRWVNRVCGGIFAAMGGVVLTMRRHA
jgi:threonine/homoserine/homoserine lactone efflux protein